MSTFIHPINCYNDNNNVQLNVFFSFNKTLQLLRILNLKANLAF